MCICNTSLEDFLYQPKQIVGCQKLSSLGQLLNISLLFELTFDKQIKIFKCDNISILFDWFSILSRFCYPHCTDTHINTHTTSNPTFRLSRLTYANYFSLQ